MAEDERWGRHRRYDGEEEWETRRVATRTKVENRLKQEGLSGLGSRFQRQQDSDERCVCPV